MAQKQEKKISKPDKQDLLLKLKELIESARRSVVRHVDHTMTITYFLVGRYIVEDEQQGKERAEYAAETLKIISRELSKEYGKGYSERNLQMMRRFYLVYQTRYDGELISQTASAESDKVKKIEANYTISQTVSANFSNLFLLSWSHYQLLCRIENEEERNFYEIESAQNNWSFRELERQFNSSLYERLALSRNKKQMKELSKTGQVLSTPSDAIKDPLVLEFLGLKEEASYSESDLETAIINKLEHFLLEMGKGFLFVGRQVRISFEEEHFYIDLVLYNRLLKCFVIIELKIGKLKHQDIGQMQMYVNYYDRQVKAPEENKTIGIVICKDKKDAVVEMTLPEDNRQIFASKYQLYLPSKEELKALIENDRQKK
ncbi:MAG: DUF1016 family protein [Prolixibacteraceae bacterium]|nr:DUF1016 family protein [Prolixibacteraceae bacterium]